MTALEDRAGTAVRERPAGGGSDGEREALAWRSVALHASIVGPIPDGADPDEYDRLRRRVLWSMPTGLYLLGTRAGARRNLMTCNLVSQLATRPKLVGVAVERDALSLQLVRDGQGFCLSMLDRSDRAVVRRFAKPAIDDPAAETLSGMAYSAAPVSGSPVLAIAVAFVDCRLDREVDLGSHVLCIGEVAAAGFGGRGEGVEVLRSEDTRMNYGG